MPTQPDRSETDSTQPANPKAQPEPAKRKPGDYPFQGLRDPGRPLMTRPYARLVSRWAAGIGLDP